MDVIILMPIACAELTWNNYKKIFQLIRINPLRRISGCVVHVRSIQKTLVNWKLGMIATDELLSFELFHDK